MTNIGISTKEPTSESAVLRLTATGIEDRSSSMNTLYYGDNLDVLRQHVVTESVDLIYLDPPFNSNRSYNVLFKAHTGRGSQAQIEPSTTPGIGHSRPRRSTSGSGRWRPGQGGRGHRGHARPSRAERRPGLPGDDDRPPGRAHRVLKPTGSLYLHCDPTASHYLKMTLDAIFGPATFVAQIIWQRTNGNNDCLQGSLLPGRIHDVILYYCKRPLRPGTRSYAEYVRPVYSGDKYRYTEPGTGRRYPLERHARSPSPPDRTSPTSGRGTALNTVLGVLEMRTWKPSTTRVGSGIPTQSRKACNASDTSMSRQACPCRTSGRIFRRSTPGAGTPRLSDSEAAPALGAHHRRIV